MEVILKKDIKGLGYKNDLISVKPGYGRNYLIPQGYAVLGNESNKKILAENIKQASHKAEKLKGDAQTKAAGIEKASIEIGTKIGESGKIFGAITTLQISDALKAKGIDVDRKQISFPVNPKEAGEFVAEIDLHKEVQTSVTFKVVGE